MTIGDDGAILRGNAVAGVEYRYPFIASTGSVTHVVEPIGQIIARPNSVGDQQEIPNEDALSLVFDDTLLFDIDKFSGYDRIETGTRANVGVRYTAQFASGAYARAVFGESYQLAGQNEYDTEFYRTSGLATDASDYVSGLYIQASSNLGFSAQSRFDQETFDIRRTDLGSWARYGPARREGELCRRHRRARTRGRRGAGGNRDGRRACRSPRLGRCSATSATTSRPSRPSPTASACATRTTVSCST